ncbi:MAG: sigma-54-dependent Fis family transcriptional regulator [Rubrivivax sp.]|nr:MAG: sigma-54-dependent Fis family transcriptional regulator [Rubrivivax sp.]
MSLLSAGAADFISVPFDTQDLLARLHRAIGSWSAAPSLPPGQAPAPALRELVGNSPAFVKQLAMLPTIAGCDAGVLILGETGTGKEVCARAIHYSSARSTRPMVAVNCGAIPAELLESELFGHVRGAFTSAHATRAGLVREAEGGTLFLDEIDALPLPAQAKLLRFLQDMEFRPVGSDTVLKADVRVIAACNQDLPGLVDRGLFRRDLFFRLHVLTVVLPPLRDRAEDICTLALRFMQQFSARSKRPALGLSPLAAKRLLTHDWPGNVRELKHVMERAVLLCQGAMIQADDLQLQSVDDGIGLDESFQAAKTRVVDAFERSYIERLLVANGGNITQAAEVAQKHRRALFELIRKHGISAERFRAKDLSAH